MNKMIFPLRKLALLSVIFILAWPAMAYANAGVPMIFLSYPIMIVALLPIILIESSIFQKAIGTSYKKALASNGTANAISTLAGFPIAWGLLFGFEMLTTGGGCGPGFDTIPKSIITVIVEAAWICPWEDQLYWMIPTAFTISLFVAFFVSVLIEYSVNKRFHKDHDKNVVKKAVYKINLISYGLLSLVGTSYFIFLILERT